MTKTTNQQLIIALQSPNCLLWWTGIEGRRLIVWKFEFGSLGFVCDLFFGA